MDKGYCAYAKSDMTPCVIRDGGICYAGDTHDRPVCVGCGRRPEQTHIAVPKGWAEDLAAYKRKHERRSR